MASALLELATEDEREKVSALSWTIEFEFYDEQGNLSDKWAETVTALYEIVKALRERKNAR